MIQSVYLWVNYDKKNYGITMTDLQRRLKLLLCLSTSSTKIHSARVMVTCAKMVPRIVYVARACVQMCSSDAYTTGVSNPQFPLGQ